MCRIIDNGVSCSFNGFDLELLYLTVVGPNRLSCGKYGISC